MFDFDAGKFLIVGVIALIFIPPKDLPRVLRQVGQFVGKMRRMAAEFQGQFMEAMRDADMADIRREAQKLADTVRIDAGFDSVNDLTRKTSADLESKKQEDAAMAETPHRDATLAVRPDTAGGMSIAPAQAAEPAAEAERLASDARQGEARQGEARQGDARQGEARQGEAAEVPPVRHSA